MNKNIEWNTRVVMDCTMLFTAGTGEDAKVSVNVVSDGSDGAPGGEFVSGQVFDDPDKAARRYYRLMSEGRQGVVAIPGFDFVAEDMKMVSSGFEMIERSLIDEHPARRQGGPQIEMDLLTSVEEIHDYFHPFEGYQQALESLVDQEAEKAARMGADFDLLAEDLAAMSPLEKCEFAAGSLGSADEFRSYVSAILNPSECSPSP